ncbi:hypothetical protein D3C87_2189800 [compost metagenome]
MFQFSLLPLQQLFGAFKPICLLLQVLIGTAQLFLLGLKLLRLALQLLCERL